jgi:hypothetical protein
MEHDNPIHVTVKGGFRIADAQPGRAGKYQEEECGGCKGRRFAKEVSNHATWVLLRRHQAPLHWKGVLCWCRCLSIPRVWHGARNNGLAFKQADI